MLETAPTTLLRAEPVRTARRRYLPLGIDVSGLKCLVVGGGRVGARKTITLAEAGASVTVVSPDVHDRLRPLIIDGIVRWLPTMYAPSHLDGCSLVVAATDQPALNVRIGRDAAEHGVLACLVSPGGESRVLFPATYRRNGITISVHTDGRDCAESRRVRDEIAGILARRGAAPARFAVFGLSRSSVPPGVFQLLWRIRITGGDLGGVDVALVSTCRRWECYFTSAFPGAVAREIVRVVRERGGVSLDAYRPALYTKSATGAFHHLLRVAAGLDSPVLGETEIVGQVRRAVAGMGAAPSALRSAFAGVLLAQRSIRAESGLSSVRRTWADAVVSALRGRFAQLAGRRVLLVGCGRLAESVAPRLLDERAFVLAFSRRAGLQGVAWCGRLGVAVREPTTLDNVLPTSDAVIVTSELPDALAERLRRHGAAGRLFVVDLTGNERLGDTRCNLVVSPVAPASPDDAVRAARADKLALIHALKLHRSRSAQPPSVRALRIGARPGDLSCAQVEEVKRFLRELLPGSDPEIAHIETPGDRDKQTPLPQVADDDFFTRDIDAALLRGEIDLAVHSAKDLPRQIPDGLHVAALTPAFAPWECLVSRGNVPLSALPKGALIGTSCDRRRARLLELRPDLAPLDVRGNVPDRIRQLDECRFDAIILAAAGLIRLGLGGRIAQVFSPEEFPPAPGQGALALVTRADDAELRYALEPLDLGERNGMPWA